MPTIIDALVVTLGLDPSGFKKGEKEVKAGLKSTGDDATRIAKEMEMRGRQAAQFFSRIRNEALALAAVLIGAAGIKEFVGHMTVADAAVGRFAKNVGMAVQEVSAWQGVARQNGGTAEGMAGSIQNLTNQFQQLALTGRSDIIPFLNAAHVDLRKFFDASVPMSEKLLTLSDAFSKMAPARAQTLGAGMGLDSNTINLLMQGRTAVQQQLEEMRRIGVVSERDTKAAQELQRAWVQLREIFEDTGRKILTEVSPSLRELLATLKALVAENKEQIAKAVRDFVDWVKTVDWKGASSDLKEFGHDIDAVAKAVGGWEKVGIGFLAIWGGAKMLGVLTRIIEAGAALKIIAGAAGGAGAEAAGGAAAGASAGMLARLAPWLAALLALKPSPTNEGEDAYIKAHPEQFPTPPSKEELDQLKVAPPGRNWWDALRGAPSPIEKQQSERDLKQLMGYGWSRDQAIGILANLRKESAGNANAMGDNGKAYGLAQWHPDRQRDFAKVFGHDIRQSTREEQLAFVNWELANSYKAAGDALRATKGAGPAGAVVSRQYEKPKFGNSEAIERGALAQQLSDLLGPGPAPDPVLLDGARSSPAARSQAGSTTNNTSSNEAHIGQVTINTAAKDADGIARDFSSSMRRWVFANQANTGLA